MRATSALKYYKPLNGMFYDFTILVCKTLMEN